MLTVKKNGTRVKIYSDYSGENGDHKSQRAYRFGSWQKAEISLENMDYYVGCDCDVSETHRVL